MQGRIITRGTFSALPLAWVAMLAACDASEEHPQPVSRPVYQAVCNVTLESTAEPPTWEGTGRGAGMDAAEAAAWAEVCPQVGLPPNCRDSLPEGIERSSWACMGFASLEGTGIELAEPLTHQCTVGLRDVRHRQVVLGTMERQGSDEETAHPEALCAEAIAQACQQVGAQGDCTAGDAPAFRVSATRSSRQLQTGGGGR